MLIFLALVVGPGCGFMLYALYQFSREARRFRHADPRRLSVTVVRAADRSLGTEGDEPAQGKPVAWYVQSCFARIPTGIPHTQR
jgi:hypothetical protein